ncbi:energy transducer TonB [Dyadobacter sp. CY345]|uniref:energy transducer TonB n=1 Tax=Dyadobacter sp. CY345 TaxID=2909335 RepID=UPI001F23638B|nr:energy transducer TonB [Dyadobacter sp. CY345]MCF2443601.1 energy transducer TonB [Dyadobacter sp. CY345]
MSAIKLVFWLFCFCCFSAQAQSDSVSTPERTVYTIAEEHPRFRGEAGALREYLRKNLRYPKEALKEGIERRVFVTFIITENGKIEDVQVLKPEVPAFDTEAVRLVNNMPGWIPGKIKGKAVACRYNLVVNFSRH